MFYIGLDLGQTQDYTAIAIVERPDARRGFQAWANCVRAGVRLAVRGGGGWGWRGSSGGGYAAGAGLKCEITTVTITNGDRETGRGSLDVGVPKRDLI